MESLLVGLFLIANGIVFAAKKDRFANGVRRYYWSLPQRHRGPAWWRWQFRPTDQQANTVALVLIVTILIVGLFALGIGVRAVAQ